MNEFTQFTEVYRHGLCSVLAWQCFDDSMEFGRREYWKWVSVYAGDAVWEGHSDSKWQAIADGLFRFSCVAGFAGDGISNPIWLYHDVVDTGLAHPCV
jgi:hypothetical protein